MEVWLNHPSNVLSKKNLKVIEEGIQKFVIPEGVGRLPSKITAHFGGFTADQWRNWITIYSSILLWGILDQDHWECWVLFVRAIKLICCRVVNLSNVAKTNSLSQQFCVRLQELYGDKACTINMHIHLHLHQSLQDYCPTYAFWLYAFKRYNGILGSFHTNNNEIKCQIMTRFLESQFTSVQASNNVFDTDFLNVLPKEYGKLNNHNIATSETTDANIIQLLELPILPYEVITLEMLTAFGKITRTIGPFKEKVLTSLEEARLIPVLREWPSN